MTNPILRWTASPSANVQQYAVAWSVNGAAAGTLNVAQSAAGDSGGYETDFAAANPTVTLRGGDVVDASVTAVDVTDSLLSSPMTAPALTIAVTAPLPPPEVTLTLT